MAVMSIPQLVYGHVSRQLSGRGREGYQTLFATPSHFAGDERNEIEARFFLSSQGETEEKHLFFVTGGNHFVIGRAVAVEGADQHGRRGLFLAHALVLDAADFAALHCNPMPLLADFGFFSSLEEALAHGDAKSGVIPPAVVDLAPIEPRPAWQLDGVPVHRIVGLVGLAIHSDDLRKQSSGVGFYGNSAWMMKNLGILFGILPNPIRSRCTFDTAFSGGTLSRLPYWAVGLPGSAPRSPSLLPIEEEREGDSSASHFQFPPAPFERWITSRVASATHTSPAEVADAFWVGEAIEGRPVDPELLVVAKREVADEVVAGSQSDVEKRVLHILTAQVGGPLTERIASAVSHRLGSEGWDIMQALRCGFSPQDLAALVFDESCGQAAPPDSGALEGLSRLLAHVEHPRLRMMHLRWMEDWSLLEESLRACEFQDFRWFVTWAFSHPRARFVWSTSPEGQPFLVCSVAQGETAASSEQPLYAAIVRSIAGRREPRTASTERSARMTTGATRQTTQRRRVEVTGSVGCESPSSLTDFDEVRWKWLLGELAGMT